jgi:hypothetical protein
VENRPWRRIKARRCRLRRDGNIAQEGKYINWNFDVQSGRERDRREKREMYQLEF